MKLTEAQARNALQDAARRWGDHPMDWPVPPRARPWRLGSLLRPTNPHDHYKLEGVFGYLPQEALDRFWSQPGQSPYEDAGGAMMRRYEAMLGLPVERLPTYAEFIDGMRAEQP